ncbi:hypothetical protein MRB53_013871 [Persea americana]|uniref:Uncharacterized protein n=1 Tax=Persea americana TaxID=3435 RepID=A0ACC2K994_PERAE|nr:hypothetical protein MRB53_013871 [Persea americana]
MTTVFVMVIALANTPDKEDKKPSGLVGQGTKHGFGPCTATKVTKYRSFLKRRVPQGGRQAFEVKGRTEQVTVAIPAGQQTNTTAAEAETSSWSRRQVANPSSSKEEEEEMVLRCRSRVPIADLVAQVFRDRAADALTSASNASSLPLVPASTSPVAVVEDDVETRAVQAEADAA